MCHINTTKSERKVNWKSTKDHLPSTLFLLALVGKCVRSTKPTTRKQALAFWADKQTFVWHHKTWNLLQIFRWVLLTQPVALSLLFFPLKFSVLLLTFPSNFTATEIYDFYVSNSEKSSWLLPHLTCLDTFLSASNTRPFRSKPKFKLFI